MQHPLPFDKFIQIALVVDDMDTALTHWCRLLDLPRPDVRVTGPEPDPNETYRGETAAYGLKFAVLECPDRGFVIELHEPDDNPSTFQEFRAGHGAGVHHIGFEVGTARDAVVEEMESLGYPVRNVGRYPGGSWTVMDTESVLGVNVNVKPRA